MKEINQQNVLAYMLEHPELLDQAAEAQGKFTTDGMKLTVMIPLNRKTPSGKYFGKVDVTEKAEGGFRVSGPGFDIHVKPNTKGPGFYGSIWPEMSPEEKKEYRERMDAQTIEALRKVPQPEEKF